MNGLRAIAGIFAVVVSVAANAEEMKFFDSGIDYWSKPRPTTERISEIQTPTKIEARSADERPAFDWQKVMDPKNDEFFREGDYMPPAAFMEVARDPSDHNIRMWRAYIAKKNELTTRFNRRLLEYGARNSSAPQAATPAQDVQAVNDLDPKRFRFRMYFDSECPHCKRMMTTLAELAHRGFYVEAMQVDERPLHINNAPFPITRASAADVKSRNISSVPFLLIGDLEAEIVYRMTGFKTVDEIFGELGVRKRGEALVRR